MATQDALTDPLQRWDPKSQELAYNNFTDRMKIELPERGSVAASGVVSIVSASGTDAIPVYLTVPIPVAVAVDIESDSIKIYSASGTMDIGTYIQNTVKVFSNDLDIRSLDQSQDSVRSYSASGTANFATYMTDPIYVHSQPGTSVNVNDNGGSLTVDDGGGSITIDDALGSITVDGIVSANEIDPTSKTVVKKRYTYNAAGNVETVKTALAATASGNSCLLTTYIYDANNRVDYTIESINTW